MSLRDALEAALSAPILSDDVDYFRHPVRFLGRLSQMDLDLNPLGPSPDRAPAVEHRVVDDLEVVDLLQAEAARELLPGDFELEPGMAECRVTFTVALVAEVIPKGTSNIFGQRF